MVTNNVDPNLDGITHVNVYSKGMTELGRLLSNFAHTPFYVGNDLFQSVESWWYWVKMNNINGSMLIPMFDENNIFIIKNKIGVEAKKYFRSLNSCEDSYLYNPTKDELKIIYCIKLNTHPNIGRLLLQNKLPLSHYYKMGDKKVDANDYLWTVELWEEIVRENI